MPENPTRPQNPPQIPQTCRLKKTIAQQRSYLFTKNPPKMLLNTSTNFNHHNHHNHHHHQHNNYDNDYDYDAQITGIKNQLVRNRRYQRMDVKEEIRRRLVDGGDGRVGGRLGKGLKYSHNTNRIHKSKFNSNMKDSKKTDQSLELFHNSSQHTNISPRFQSTERYIKRSYSITEPNQNPNLTQSHNFQLNLHSKPNPSPTNPNPPKKILRTKSLQTNSTLTKMQRLQHYNQLQKIRFNLNFNKQQNRYKNQKLNILAQEHQAIIKKLPNYLIDRVKIKADFYSLRKLFEGFCWKHGKDGKNGKDGKDGKDGDADVCLSRYGSHGFRTAMGLMVFYIGYEIYVRYCQDFDTDDQVYQLVLSNIYQIYYAMKLKAPLLILECYLNLIDIALTDQNYEHAQRYSQKCLIASIFYSQKYYQQRCIQKISMCEYYKGNVCEATYLHDNNGQLTQNSIRQLRENYNEQEEMEILFHHLFEVPKFSIEELLKDYQERMDGYKSIVVFKSPRVGPEDSFQEKKEQLRVDLRRMERLREFKKEAEIIRKEVKRHQGLFTVKNMGESDDEFKLIKRNLVINEENESSQVLRVHQSLNRIKKTGRKSLSMKLKAEFMEFLNKIQCKFSDFI